MNSSNTPDIGSLQVAVYATDIGKPINNAQVRITLFNERQPVIEELQTDISGQTQLVELPAPPLEYSQQPNEPQPYSEYDVSVVFEGYKPAIIQGVQILPDSIAYQNVNLFPLEVPGEPVESIDIEAHTLYGTFPPKIPEESVKPLPESKGFVVLPKVVVPEYVVVHAGVPTNNRAPNYWIPFTDYIKNVASCEIYSTWPDSTIRANVLAIISFTLNRVYTEWYRGKGYYFTITNSTAYDQAFVYGRNIYRNISNIVDQIFTTFVTKPDIKQPLFTQYCDGSRSSCPGWLSQWGSKELGQRGYTPINILKYYYGQEIFLLDAEKVEGVPISYPGTPLRVGSRGANVRTIQLQLNAISNNYSAIPKLRVDGIYGPLTKKSVETFQRIFRLPVTGIVDYATWYQISNIFVAVTKLAEL
ncbi:MAG: peptidoglycan-binding protein [Clostridiales bacterium GWF2_38_85]|nr:MAG: peptidoglycan-binding protein [Clostridiales bacterium GWF2_38_85]HBL83790.1 peptidoglycan-binding protein [Clostridiales bacterium]